MAMTKTIRIRAILPAALTLIAALVSTSSLPSAAQPSAATPAATTAAAQAPPAPRPSDELIRADVEQLRATGDLDLGGVMIASRVLLPRIYEARGFAPTWRTQPQ